jgi:hypothetical protein
MTTRRRAVLLAVTCFVAGTMVGAEVPKFRTLLATVSETRKRSDVLRNGLEADYLADRMNDGAGTGRPETLKTRREQADRDSEDAWNAMCDARRYWLQTEQEASFYTYLSALREAEAADILSMVPRGIGKQMLNTAEVSIRASKVNEDLALLAARKWSKSKMERDWEGIQ